MRSPLAVTWSVWRALFLREGTARTSGDRFAWFWMLAEPVAFVVVMVSVRELMGRVRLVVGAEWVPWLLVGVTAFFLFREGLLRSMNAIEANKAMFAYRQVAPIDPVLVRNVVEGLLKTVVLLILVLGASLLGYHILPSNPLGAMTAWLALWLLGMGGGLVVSVAASLVKEIGMVVRMAMLPMLILSGVIVPLQNFPHQVQQYLLYNPVVHGLETLRLAFFHNYKSLSGVEFGYLWYWIIGSVTLGLILHLRFAHRLKAQ
jgi:capsular polysaccharide transport system permease protein